MIEINYDINQILKTLAGSIFLCSTEAGGRRRIKRDPVKSYHPWRVLTRGRCIGLHSYHERQAVRRPIGAQHMDAFVQNLQGLSHLASQCYLTLQSHFPFLSFSPIYIKLFCSLDIFSLRCWLS